MSRPHTKRDESFRFLERGWSMECNMERNYAVIPACDPSDSFIRVVRDLNRKGFEILVVNDGSKPECRCIFDQIEPMAVVLTHPENRGKGEALKTAFRHLILAGAAGTVVTLDCDGQHSVADTVHIAKTSQAYPEALVLGVRDFSKGAPFRSRFGNRFSSMIFRMITGVKISDTQTGLRAFGTGLLPFMMDIDGSRFEYETNVLTTAAKNKISMVELPIETIYIEGNKSSHFAPVRDSLKICGSLLRFSLSSLISFATDYSLYALLVNALEVFGTAVSVPAANIGARVVSASLNYYLNRNYVFHSDERTLKTASQYFLLACAILIGNTFMVSYLAEINTIGAYGAKLITEIFFFAISWSVQRCWIFRKRSKGKNTAPAPGKSEQNKEII